ncbi:hypothetical protein GGI21_000131 [Coemansia aciculifera]|nr:hypothetical protein GGI21_000131 [Coemansia aciculifera]
MYNTPTPYYRDFRVYVANGSSPKPAEHKGQYYPEEYLLDTNELDHESSITLSNLVEKVVVIVPQESMNTYNGWLCHAVASDSETISSSIASIIGGGEAGPTEYKDIAELVAKEAPLPVRSKTSSPRPLEPSPFLDDW